MYISTSGTVLTPSHAETPSRYQNLAWTRTPAPVFTRGVDSGAWDYQSIYNPIVVRNLDRSLYRGGSNNIYMYYTGDNTGPPGDLDQCGLARATNIAGPWTRYGTAPVIPLGPPGSPDDADVQLTSVWKYPGEFFYLYQGNSEPSIGDNMTICFASSADGLSITKGGALITYGTEPDGDADGLYFPKLLPSSPFGPMIYYTGQSKGLRRGIMCAHSPSGNVRGPYAKLVSSHIFRHGNTWLVDVWFEGGLWHFLYFPGVTGEPDMHYATSENGRTIIYRGVFLAARSGQWDSNVYRGQGLFTEAGVSYVMYDDGLNDGVGYSSATVPP